ncbi:MAG: colicin V production protein [Betaproteobacteria bacterium HGW-Betaproteobacteria-11]|nr:MAG: colicin V production protein [Betaproteobacteria bacterium HGW-Betaproteobacteria-11]
MTIFDYGVLAILATSVLLGFWRGVVSEILALVAWVVAFLVARAQAWRVVPLLGEQIPDPALKLAAGFAVVFIGVLVVFLLARLLLSMLLQAAGLGFLDRLLGACFGVLRGGLVVLVGVAAGGMTALPKAVWWREAVFAPPLETAVIAAKPWLPAEVAKRIRFR